MVKKILLVILLFIQSSEFVIDAADVINQTGEIEQYEKQCPLALKSCSLTVLEEENYNIIDENKNSSAIMSERKYYKNELDKKRIYTFVAIFDYRTINKYLHYIEGLF